jgi:hypothetical protein
MIWQRQACVCFHRFEPPKSKATRREPIPRQLVKLPGDWSQVYLCDFSQAKRTVSQGTASLNWKTILRKACKILFQLSLTSNVPAPLRSASHKKSPLRAICSDGGRWGTGNTHPRAASSRPRCYRVDLCPSVGRIDHRISSGIAHWLRELGPISPPTPRSRPRQCPALIQVQAVRSYPSSLIMIESVPAYRWRLLFLPPGKQPRLRRLHPPRPFQTPKAR